MDRVAEVLDVLGGHNPCDGTDCGHMVCVPATALVRHKLCRRASRQSCGRFAGSKTESQVGHGWVDVRSLTCHVCLPRNQYGAMFTLCRLSSIAQTCYCTCCTLTAYICNMRRSFGTLSAKEIVQLSYLKGKGWGGIESYESTIYRHRQAVRCLLYACCFRCCFALV
jgi:hypothetical protein